ncbi:MAG: EAL domain-containing protein [Rhodocyclales bacterium]|nr:EAL domain-containing protein [Rhodocyclales bacterium]
MTEPEPAASSEAFGVSPDKFVELLKGKLAARQQGGKPLAVLIIECGLVGRIDSVWGYHVGNAVRQRVTSLLCAEVLRPGDFVGEFGRDEFACVLESIDNPAVALLAAGKTLRTLNAPFWVGDEEIYAAPAIGVALCPTHADHADALLQRARSACTLARNVPGRIAEYDADLDLIAESKLLLDSRLRTAVADNKLELAFQPQYDLRLGQMMGAEGILRWADLGQGALDVESAFAAAETLDQVPDLLSSILNRALRNISEFRYSAGLDLRVGVRLPGSVLRHPEIVDVIQRSLGTWSRRPGTLILGISQTSALLADDTARETLVRVKEIGVKLAIDDPVMRIASLFKLVALPFQEIRLDFSLAGGESVAPKAEKIQRSLIDLAHQVRLGVLATGVSDEAAAMQLKTLGCDYMQADFKGPAVAPKEFVERYGFSED